MALSQAEVGVWIALPSSPVCELVGPSPGVPHSWQNHTRVCSATGALRLLPGRPCSWFYPGTTRGARSPPPPGGGAGFLHAPALFSSGALFDIAHLGTQLLSPGLVLWMQVTKGCSARVPCQRSLRTKNLCCQEMLISWARPHVPRRQDPWGGRFSWMMWLCSPSPVPA